MQIINLKLEELKVYEKNARTHPKKQIDLLAKNIEKFGFTTPVLIDRDNNIIAGHGRVLAMKQLNRDEVPCVRMENLDEEQVKALRLADNKLNESDWDMNLVIEELKGLSEEMLDLTGFDKDLIIEPDERDDEVPETPEEPQSKLGDLYELGSHRVLCGDSTKIEDVERLMDGKKADMVFTDPPYGFNYIKKSDMTSIQNDGDEFEQVIYDALSLHSPEVAFVCGDAKTVVPFLRATSPLGEPKTVIVWAKPIQHRMHKFEPCHEFIWYWGDNGSPFYGGNVFQAKREIEKFHPTIKPVELVSYCIRAVSQTFLVDPFLGSGSTLIASEKTGRICYGMELDPKYVDVIVQRYVDYTGNEEIVKNGEKITWNKSQKTKE